MSRKQLPKNYSIKNPSLIENFSTLSQWTLNSSGSTTSQTQNVQYVKEGTSSLCLTGTGGTAAFTRKTVSFNFSNTRVFRLRVYIPDVSTLNKLSLYLSSSSTFSVYFYYTVSGSRLVTGWNDLLLDRDKFTNSGDSWSNTMVKMQIRIDPNTGVDSSVIFDGIYVDSYHRPKLLFTFDDNWLTQYTEAYARMSAKGLKGTIAVIPSKVGTTNYMSLSQLQEVYNAGWDLANHTYNHVYLGNITEAEMEQEIKSTTDWLNSNGFTRASNILVYPYGSYNDTTIKVAKRNGIRAARTITEFVETSPAIEPYKIKIRNCINTVTPATAMGWIDEAIKTGGTVILLFHRIETPAPDSMFFDVSSFQALVDYAYTKRLQIDTVTFTEWLDGIDLSRKRVIRS